MSAPLREPMLPSRSFLGGFLEEYSATDYPDVVSSLFMQHNHVLQDANSAPAVQVFAEGGQVRAIRLHLDGYFIVPLKRITLNPGYIFAVARRLVYLDGKAPWRTRARFWIVAQLLGVAEWLLR